LRGKVVLKSKLPAQGQSKALCDDFDTFNDVDPFAPDAEDYLFGTKGDISAGSTALDSTRNLDKDHSESVKEAQIEADRAKKAASAAEDKAFNANVKVNRAKEFSDKLLRKAGITPEIVKVKINKRAKDALDALEEEVVSRSSKEDGDEAIASIATGSVYTAGDKTIAVGKRSLFQQLLSCAGAIDGDDTVAGTYFDREVALSMDASTIAGTYFDHEDREAALSMNDSTVAGTYFDGSEDDDSRDDAEYEFDFDFDMDVNLFSPTNLMSEFKAALKARENAEEKHRRVEHFQMQKRSISNVNKKLQLQESRIVDDGVEVEHFYSSTVDFALADHKEAEEGVEKAAKVLGVATAIFNKCQEEYEKVKPEVTYFRTKVEIEETLQ
jgi:hypothetical protein